jgi:hypothetical protein
MFLLLYCKCRSYLLLLISIFLYCQQLVSAADTAKSTVKSASLKIIAEKVNLALRRTADGLLRANGDSTSRIDAVEQTATNIWRIKLDRPFRYEQLPFILQSSLMLYEISNPYQVAIRRCGDATIDLGYHQFDFVKNNSVPCSGREMPESCHYIEITFLEASSNQATGIAKTGILLLLTAGIAGYWYYRKRQIRKPMPGLNTDQVDWLEFGNSKLDVEGQILVQGNVRQSLTFRETKLLRLFVASPNRLLERDFILNQVWQDEGVLVGRSIDVFVSRLRKKLAADPSVGIVAVHGMGYRLETGK